MAKKKVTPKKVTVKTSKITVTPPKMETIYCPVDLPQVGLRITIEGKQYTVTSDCTVKDKQGNEYKVVFK